MTMLFFPFLRVTLNRYTLQVKHLWVALSNLIIPLGAYFLFLSLGQNVALAAFVVGAAPTAAGAPVIAGFLRTRIEFVTGSVLLTSPMVALMIPLVLPELQDVGGAKMNTLEVLLPVAGLVFIPLILGQTIQRTSPPLARWLSTTFDWAPFTLFLANVYLAAAKATHFILTGGNSWAELGQVALAITVTGLLCFWWGEKVIGRPELPIECGLALGRKNTMFVLWVALNFINPLVAMGPMFYILFQNLYNSWQLYNLEKK